MEHFFTATLGNVSTYAETAIIKTSEGSMTCELFTKEASNTVANFLLTPVRSFLLLLRQHLA